MSDLIKRLDASGPADDNLFELCMNAMDEIERLTNELRERREQVEEYQQTLDEIVVALGSLAITTPEIVAAIKALQDEIERLTNELREARDTIAELKAALTLWEDTLPNKQETE